MTVTGIPTDAGATTRWGFGCDPYESDLGSGRCVVNISDARNFVSVSFDGSDPAPRPPFNQVVHLKVQRAGDGQGQIQGSGKSAGLDDPPWSIDCGSACDFDRLQYQTQVRLRAVKAAGSVFDSWAGPPCLSEETCTFTVGRYPKVVAVFKKTGLRCQRFSRPRRPGRGRRGPSSPASGRTAPLARTCGCCATGGG